MESASLEKLIYVFETRLFVTAFGTHEKEPALQGLIQLRDCGQVAQELTESTLNFLQTFATLLNGIPYNGFIASDAAKQIVEELKKPH